MNRVAAANRWKSHTSAAMVTADSEIRTEADGTLDPSFGGDGRGTTLIGFFASEARALALAPDGRIVAGGSAYVHGTYDFALARYENDGTLDPTLGGDGTVTTDLRPNGRDQAYAMALLSDGRMVVAGSSENGDDADLALARYMPDGSLDPSFGGDGTVITDRRG